MVLLQTAAAGNTLSIGGMACDESLEVLKVKVATKTCRGVGKFYFNLMLRIVSCVKRMTLLAAIRGGHSEL